MIGEPALIDSDTLSELSRGQRHVLDNARRYLERHGRFTVSAVSVYERLRGYRAALRQGKPFEAQLEQFVAFAATCLVLPVDADVADVAATIWARSSARRRKKLGDILIAATACARGLAVVTRNRRDFAPLLAASGVDVAMADWARSR